MKKETLLLLKAKARNEIRIPPAKKIENKTKYKRKEKHRTGYQNDDSGPFFIPALSA